MSYRWLAAKKNMSFKGLPADCGEKSFAPGVAAGDTGILNRDVTATTNGIQFSTNEGTAGLSVTIPVTVTMQNYESVSLNAVSRLVDKTSITITVVDVTDKVYNRTPAGYTGTPANEQGYTGTYEYIWSAICSNAGAVGRGRTVNNYLYKKYSDSYLALFSSIVSSFCLTH